MEASSGTMKDALERIEPAESWEEEEDADDWEERRGRGRDGRISSSEDTADGRLMNEDIGFAGLDCERFVLTVIVEGE